MKWITFTLAMGLWCASGCAWFRPPKETAPGAGRGNRGQVPPPTMMGTGSEPGQRIDDVPKLR